MIIIMDWGGGQPFAISCLLRVDHYLVLGEWHERFKFFSLTDVKSFIFFPHIFRLIFSVNMMHFLHYFVQGAIMT